MKHVGTLSIVYSFFVVSRNFTVLQLSSYIHTYKEVVSRSALQFCSDLDSGVEMALAEL